MHAATTPTKFASERDPLPRASEPRAKLTCDMPLETHPDTSTFPSSKRYQQDATHRSEPGKSITPHKDRSPSTPLHATDPEPRIHP
eukprot:2014780-Pyramimonas_sp.AAC.1